MQALMLNAVTMVTSATSATCTASARVHVAYSLSNSIPSDVLLTNAQKNIVLDWTKCQQHLFIDEAHTF